DNASAQDRSAGHLAISEGLYLIGSSLEPAFCSCATWSAAPVGVKFSFDEWVPKRPPRPQKLPLASGTVQLDTPNGFDSVVMSAIHTICRVSRHSLVIASSVMTTKSRRRPSLSLANSEISTPSTGTAVCAPTFGG